MYKQTTQVPNSLFDLHLAKLTEAELKILLVTVRQTAGWLNKKTGKRKTRDRITNSQFQQKTGLSKRIITKTIQSLLTKNLIHVTSFDGKELNQPHDRKGKSYIFYGISNLVHNETRTSAQKTPKPVHKRDHNKTNYPKLNKTKGEMYFAGHIGSLLPKTSV